MLNQVDAIAPNGESISFFFQDPSNGYMIESIEGLDPVRANIVSTGFASQDGEVFQSSRLEKRNTIITLSFHPDYSAFSVSDLRNELYKYFLPKSEVTLRFFDTDDNVYEIQNYVEDFDAPLFVKDPQAIISLLAMDPAFYNPTPVIRERETSETPVTDTLNYSGTVNSGMKFTFYPDHDMSGFTITNTVAGKPTQSLVFAAEILDGDVITVSTVFGNKYARLIRDSIETSILYGVSPYADWINLYPGENNLQYSAEGASVPIITEHMIRYGGL